MSKKDRSQDIALPPARPAAPAGRDQGWPAASAWHGGAVSKERGAVPPPPAAAGPRHTLQSPHASGAAKKKKRAQGEVWRTRRRQARRGAAGTQQLGGSRAAAAGGRCRPERLSSLRGCVGGGARRWGRPCACVCARALHYGKPKAQYGRGACLIQSRGSAAKPLRAAVRGMCARHSQ